MLCKTLKIEEIEKLDSNWIAENKYDGARILFFVSDDIIMVNRNKNKKLIQFPEFNDIKNWLNCNECILDGELIVNNDFGLLATRDHLINEFKINLMSKRYPATYIAFDILWLDGEDLTKKTLKERRLTLEEIVKKNDMLKTIGVSGNPKELFKEITSQGGEGIIVKNLNSIYEFIRSENWLKVKKEEFLEVEVLGWNETTENSYGSIQTRIGDVGLLSFKNKELLDLLVKAYGWGNFFAKVKFMEISKKSGHARFPTFKGFSIKKKE